MIFSGFIGDELACKNGLNLNGMVYDENGNLITENFKVNTYTKYSS